MIYNLMSAAIVPGKMSDYQKIVGEELMPIYKRIGIKLIGSWTTYWGMGGSSNACHVLFQWDSLEQMEKQMATLMADKEFQRVYAKYQGCTTGQLNNMLLQPTPYSSLK